MANECGNPIVSLGEADHHLKNKIVVRHQCAYVLKLIEQFLELLTIYRGIREILHVGTGEFLLKSYNPRILIVLEHNHHVPVQL